MKATTNLAARLEGVVDARRVVADEEELGAFAIGGLAPCAIVRPSCAEEAAEIVRFAATERLGVIACGSRSKLDMGMPPAQWDIALDMTEMQQITHYDAGDLTLSVEVGMRLRTLEGALADKRQFLPLAVPCYETSTVGGAVSSGIDSALRRQYGTARDFLIGAEFVDGKGNLCKSGGRVVKNVTGYDLHKLLIGSLGTLGVITRLNFRTFPLPQASGGYLASFPTMEGALAFRAILEASGLPIANEETLSPGVASIVAAILRRACAALPALLDSPGWCVYASYEGHSTVVQRITHCLEKLGREAGVEKSEILQDSADDQLGGMLREAFEWLRWASPSALLFRIVLPQIAPRDLAELAKAAKAADLRCELLVRATAVIYFVVLADGESEAALGTLGEVASRVFALAESRQGHAIVLHAPESLKTQVNVWGPKRADFPLMQRVKRAFDPQNILAPGRFVGGL
jgi:glycolate oxidase FAD binding subunit